MLYDFTSYVSSRDLHSFPTRRSSDLKGTLPVHLSRWRAKGFVPREPQPRLVPPTKRVPSGESKSGRLPEAKPWRKGMHAPRSEEHTSELQSRQYLVCRLLLEKKKKNK